MTTADAVAIGRTSQYFALDGLAAHGGAHSIANAALAALRPGLEEHVRGIAAVVHYEHLGTETLELEPASGGLLQIAPEAVEGRRDDEKEALFGTSQEVDELPKAGARAIAHEAAVDEGCDDFVAVVAAVLDEHAALIGQRDAVAL